MHNHGDTGARKVLTEDQYFELTQKIVSACITVHKEMGPGLLESVYQYCLLKELNLRGIAAQGQIDIPLFYKGYSLNKSFTVDILVENEIVLELKSAEHMLPVYEAQLLSYLKLMNKKIGYLINFNVPLMKQGIKRMKNGY